MARQNEHADHIAADARRGSFVAIAIVAGVIGFTVVAILVAPLSKGTEEQPVWMFRGVLLAMALPFTVGAAIVTRIRTRSVLEKLAGQTGPEAARALARLRLTNGIIGAASGEGMGLCGAGMFLIGRDWVVLGIGLAGFAINWVWHAPFGWRITESVEDHLDAIRRE